jgi:hypothetical protein
VQPVELRVESREVERPGIFVHRDHVLAVARREQSLDAAAAAEVERRADATPHGQALQRHRGRVHTQDVVPARIRGLGVVPIVSEQDVAPGRQPHRGADSVPASLDDTERDELVRFERRDRGA